MNLPQNYALSEKSIRGQDAVELEVPDLAPPITIQGRQSGIDTVKGSGQECTYQFGHLRTLKMDAPIPDECLSCDRIIECKHSSAKPKKNQQHSVRS